MTSGADELTLGLVLAAALMHASWNALAKANGDPLVNIAVITGTGGLLALPFMAWFPWPSAETFRWLALSGVIHFLYQLNLARMYRLGDLSQVYPIARGLAPLGVAALGAAFVDERLAWPQVLGLLLSAVAIVVLGRAGARDGETSRGVGTALFVAFLIGLYTYSDGRGVRSVSNPLLYIAWTCFMSSLPFGLYTVWARRETGLASLREGGGRAALGGVLATVGYGIALWAMARTPLALVASLREASVLFAALIGAFVLRESFGPTRIVASAVLVVGLVLVQLASG
ncbi:MAG: EamA family transporter [Myxococcota bacterium]